MGSIQDRNGMDLEEAKKRWQEYTEELYKKDLHKKKKKKIFMIQIITMV